jgi:hypothetical protein
MQMNNDTTDVTQLEFFDDNDLGFRVKNPLTKEQMYIIEISELQRSLSHSYVRISALSQELHDLKITLRNINA